MPGSRGIKIGAGSGQVWLINELGAIYKYDKNENKWKQMPGSNGRDIAVSNEGIAWLINKEGKIYRFACEQWYRIGGSNGNALTANNGSAYLVNQ